MEGTIKSNELTGRVTSLLLEANTFADEKLLIALAEVFRRADGDIAVCIPPETGEEFHLQYRAHSRTASEE